MKIREIGAKSIIVKSKLPGSDYVVNPYIGCTHGCLYCYARFMKRFTNHPEPWGQFLDVKINASALVPEKANLKGKSIGFSSTTDPYLPLEERYKLTRGILEKLIPLQPDLWILTKSDLILRDIDLLKKFKSLVATISLSTLDDSLRKQTEPFAPSVERRVKAIKELKKAGIKTAVFISPIFPYLTDWRKIVKLAENFVDEFWFENLNLYPSIWPNIRRWLKNYHPNLLNKFMEVYFTRKSSSAYCTKNNYWSIIEKEIEEYGKKNSLTFKVYFHH